MFNEYPGIFRVWFGSRLFYAISDPKYYEILLPNCLNKEKWYSYAEPAVGHGLFTAPCKYLSNSAQLELTESCSGQVEEAQEAHNADL